MTSAIVPSNIDSTYPIAGQDNDSQGFRDNFTNTKTNFQRAADEITDLQSKVLLKAALIGTSSVNNNLGGVVVSSAKLQDTRLTFVTLGEVNGTVGINYSSGHYQSLITTGNINLEFGSTFPSSASSSAGFIILRMTIDTAGRTVTLPDAVPESNLQGIQGASVRIITFAETGTYEFVFHSTDGGTTIFVHELTRPRSYFTNAITCNANVVSTSTTTGSLKIVGGIGVSGNISVGGDINSAGNIAGNAAVVFSGNEDLADAAVVSLTKLTSYFTTAAAETSTLADGTEGQIKIFTAVDVSAGDMVITVANPGWLASGSGTATFGSYGDSCTLQYTDGKWYCIGNNGTDFA